MISKLALKMYAERLEQIDIDIKKAARKKDKRAIAVLYSEKKRIKESIGV